MTKEELAQLCKTAGQKLREVNDQYSQVKEELDAFKKEARVNKLVSKMVDSGLVGEDAREEKVAQILERDDLAVLEEAVDLSTSEKLSKIASVAEEDGSGADPISTYLLGS